MEDTNRAKADIAMFFVTVFLLLGFNTLCLRPFENVQFLPKSLDIDTPKCTAQGPSNNRFPLQLAQVTAVQ